MIGTLCFPQSKICINVNFNKMKKLGKLSINPEKVIKNEELVTLRGGYVGDCDPDAGLMCYGSCTTWWGASGTCKFYLIENKFKCGCEIS